MKIKLASRLCRLQTQSQRPRLESKPQPCGWESAAVGAACHTCAAHWLEGPCWRAGFESCRFPAPHCFVSLQLCWDTRLNPSAQHLWGRVEDNAPEMPESGIYSPSWQCLTPDLCSSTRATARRSQDAPPPTGRANWKTQTLMMSRRRSSSKQNLNILQSGGFSGQDF